MARIAPSKTMARIARFAPIIRMIVFAIDSAIPDISTTFPKIAPRRKTGKYALMKLTIFSMKIFEKNGNTQSGFVSKIANKAQIGANRMTEKPR